MIRAWSAMLTAALVAVLAGCGAERARTVRVGTKNFTEQLILGELISQLIESGTGLRVERKFNLGGTMICHGALLSGEIDLYPEYTGTALTAVLKQPVISDPDSAFALVAAAYRDRFACQWLPPLGFNNTYALTVRQARAAERGWAAISDLAAEAGELRAGFTAEFSERPDGYPGLAAAYGFRFGSECDLDPGLMYRAVAQGEVDVICAFATDGRIAAYQLRALRDDRGFFPPYYAAPVVRADALRRHPGLAQALVPLAGALSDEAMRRLNLAVDEGGEEPRQVARQFLVDNGLLGQRGY